jgi:hypothetical protein
LLFAFLFSVVAAYDAANGRASQGVVPGNVANCTAYNGSLEAAFSVCRSSAGQDARSQGDREDFFHCGVVCLFKWRDAI